MNITLHPVVFSVEPSLRLTGGPGFKNTLLEDAQGDPQSQIYWDNAKWEWSVQFVEDGGGIARAYSFFLARRGGGYAWLFDDPLDNTSSIATNTGTPIECGAVKTMADGKRYLVKIYPDDFEPYVRIIRCTIPGSIVFSGVTGTPVVNPYTGEVTGATSDGLATFRYLCPAIFATDKMQMEREPGDAGSGWAVVIREVGKFIVAS